ncbi:hypothetical protein NE237_015116 [Protea cynaroides]|uniref:RING-type domain-containing protein n=1 Tax=Protea cynaroides TaxID=273540 RepID=A0A9Q0QQR8_9MAGN|nr:hypothetical protein NE237_015116 [Protea cynaroides]
MVPSALDVSIVSSASRLLTEDQKEWQNMEDMESDLVMDVPDTPDRLAIRKNGRGGGERESTSSVAGNSENSELLCRGVPNQLRGRSKLISGNVNNKRFRPRAWEDLSIHNGIRHGSSPVVKSSDNTSVSKNAPLFRRLAHHNPRLESEPSVQPKHSEHVPSSSCGHGGDSAKLGVLAPDVGIQDGSGRKIIDLSSPEINGRNTRRKMVTGLPERSSGELKDFMAQEKRRGSIPVNDFSSFCTIANSSRVPSNDFKGKTKIDDTCIVTAGSDHMKSIDLTHDSQPNTREMMSESLHPIVSPRRTGQKRLVRNGCISPFNIAKAKQTGENHSKDFVYLKQAGIGGVITNEEGPMCQINIVDPGSGSNRTGIVKGKEVMRDLNPAEEHDVEGMHFRSRDSLTHMEEDNLIRDGSGSAFRGFQGIGGWRSTRNHSKMTSAPPFDEVVCPSRSERRHISRIENRDHVGTRNNFSLTDFVEISDQSSLKHIPNSVLAQSSSSGLSVSDRENGQHGGTNKLVKRQKKQGLVCSNIGECSTSTLDDSGIASVVPSGGPLKARSTRRRNPNHRGNSGPVMVIDELSPETRSGNFVDISQLVNNNSDARARQEEADEILARQLQEQFYSEFPVAVGELDANIARTLQQEEDARHASYHGNPHASHPRDPSMSRSHRQYPSRSFLNLSVRTTNRVQPPSSRRIGRLRTSSRTPPSRRSRLHNIMRTFEALEAAVGISNDMPLGGHLFQRDFNENDYEILLALDENNHQHAGASTDLISSLPQSTVQTENFEEVCAICLDSPSTGDIIRHLPCLHKFHRDCIDPWLGRSTSCPVCKSSIT